MHTAGQLHTPFQNQEAHHVESVDPVQKAVNSGMGFIVGDILAQRLTGEAFDAVRSLELGLYGTLLGTSVLPDTAASQAACTAPATLTFRHRSNACSMYQRAYILHASHANTLTIVLLLLSVTDCKCLFYAGSWMQALDLTQDLCKSSIASREDTLAVLAPQMHAADTRPCLS